MDKKFTLIQPLQADWAAPSPNEPWSNNTFRNMSRLLQANTYWTKSPNIELDSDIYDIVSFDIGIIEYEIELVRRLKQTGAKVLVGFSQDLRFLIGNNGLIHDTTGTLFTDLCKEADLILSGVSDDLRIYGRYQDKVFPCGEFLERLNFSQEPYEERPIDILLSGSQGEHFLPFTLEIMLMLKERNPNLRIVYAFREDCKHMIEAYKDKLEFSFDNLIKLMPHAKVYVNPELRPRPGRAMMEAWYCRTPFICSDMTYYSKLFPEYAYNKLSICDIVETAEKILKSDIAQIVKNAEVFKAEPEYFDKMMERLMKRLYP